jgi:hypothetical protein
MNLMYPTPTRKPRYAGISCHDNRHLHDRVGSISGNMGASPPDDKESRSTDGETRPKFSDAAGENQCGHSIRRLGKPDTWGRATAYQVPQSTDIPNVKAWESSPMSADRKRG